MFVAINPIGEKQFAFHDDKERLYSLAKAKELYCPHCQKNVFFRGGTKKIHHFYHERHVECSFVGEPETQEHLGGKLAIYNWLKEKYPNAYVALEERIAKTNQIADVYADFGNGHKFAFEIQCAEQTAEKWLERRKLYAIAEIKDIWLFGANYYKEITAKDIEDDEVVLRLKYPQQLVNEKERSVYFIDVENNLVKHIGKFFGIRYRTETRFVVKLQEIAIPEMTIAKIQSPCKFVLYNKLSYEKIQHYLNDRKIEAAELWKERKVQSAARMQIIRQKQEKQKRFHQYKRYLSNFNIDKVLQRMSHREQVLFRRLVKEYGLTDTNFPGIFNIQMENYKCIHTPYPLWQLLVFHKAIKHNYSKKQLIFSNYLFQDIKDQLRYDIKDSKLVATLIHSYLVLLEKCGFLYKQTLYRKYIHPFKIENNVLPLVDHKELNTHVALYFSEFNLFAIGWGDYYDIEIFSTDKVQELLEQDAQYYQNLVLHNMESPLHIEEGLIKWVQQAVTDKIIETEAHEAEFIEHLIELLREGKFISQAMHDTFLALIEEKFN
ncbi:competence protein CoiA family protein [Lysinibacillus boronitolerans]|uniref:competence protein CoiA n=1 Tax=Lysinibacillus boronitolerans TaxID=309788 RepID=UPI002163837E|nr:competence protein CoiA family protein [Lysinibacillus boronitolerans]MCS1393275.1 competence protein CoiA family protein [Lysinibacillus boronitolerans]